MAGRLGTLATEIVASLVAWGGSPHPFTARKRWKPVVAPAGAAENLVTITPDTSEFAPEDRDGGYERLYTVKAFVQRSLDGDEEQNEATSDEVDELADSIGAFLESFSSPSLGDDVVLESVERAAVVYEDEQNTQSLFVSQITLTFRAHD